MRRSVKQRAKGARPKAEPRLSVHTKSVFGTVLVVSATVNFDFVDIRLHFKTTVSIHLKHSQNTHGIRYESIAYKSLTE